jgi:hypothetical protein
MSKQEANSVYQDLNTKLIQCLARLEKAVDAGDRIAVELEDQEFVQILGEMRALLRLV